MSAESTALTSAPSSGPKAMSRSTRLPASRKGTGSNRGRGSAIIDRLASSACIHTQPATQCEESRFASLITVSAKRSADAHACLKEPLLMRSIALDSASLITCCSMGNEPKAASCRI